MYPFFIVIGALFGILICIAYCALVEASKEHKDKDI